MAYVESLLNKALALSYACLICLGWQPQASCMLSVSQSRGTYRHIVAHSQATRCFNSTSMHVYPCTVPEGGYRWLHSTNNAIAVGHACGRGPPMPYRAVEHAWTQQRRPPRHTAANPTRGGWGSVLSWDMLTCAALHAKRTRHTDAHGQPIS